jgi:hypothetical protein
MADINITEEIIDINVTEEVINIVAPTGAYPLPNAVNSVFGRIGNIVAAEGDYSLTQLSDVTLSSPSNGQVLKYNGTIWVNSSDADTGITTLNTLTALSQTFATGSSGTDFNISSATSTHTFNFPTASATNRGLLSSADFTTFNNKQNALTNPVTGTGTTNTLPKFTGASAIGNSNITDTGTAIALNSDTAIGTTTLAAATKFTLGGSETAVSAIARGQLINSTLVASANGDFTIGLDINPTFTNGAFTGVQNFGLRVSSITSLGNIAFGLIDNAFITFKNFTSSRTITLNPQSNLISSSDGLALNHNSIFTIRNNSIVQFQMFANGNVTIQNGGTFTDAGFRLDVNGTTRFIGTASSDTAPLGSELAAVTGTGTNWTLAGTNLNVGCYTHTTGSVDPLTTALAAVNGTYYQIAYTITGRTTGSITINYGGAAVGGLTATGTTGPLASSTAVLTITPTTDFNGTIVLSIKSISTSIASSTFSTSAGSSNIEVRASSSANNTFIGLQTGRRNTTGNNNTFFGSQSGINNTTGTFNTFIGTSSGLNNTTASQNIFIGFNAGTANSTGGSNTIVGTFAGQSNTTGGNNTFVGLNSGQSNNSGGSNTFVGRDAGSKNTTASNNTFLGLSAGQENTTGENNVYLGNVAGQLNTTGGNNTAVGYLALNANVGGSLNVALGQQAARFIANKSTTATVLNNSIMIGYRASPLADSQTNQIVIGHDATGLGSNTTTIGNSSTTITGLYGNIRLVSGMGTAPATSTSTGTTGDIVVTAGFIYVCTATNTWVRTALTTF